MIPLKLKLTNFLSYRKTTVLEFDGIHVACISGANGAGKSSLLDAITWVLFGKSRAKSDDDLVNKLSILDKKGAEVQFTFDLEGTVYRVIRRKKLGGRTILELQIALHEGGGNGTASVRWKSLSEGKMRQTQAAIESLLRMNYDTFTNASFLLQGKADEFTTKTPNRRKEILADLLGVSLWDRYQEAVTERRKEIEQQLALIEGSLTEIEAELLEAPAREAALEAAQTALDSIAEKLALKEQILRQMRQMETAVQQQREMVENGAKALVRAQKQLAQLQNTQAQRQQERERYQVILDQAAQIETDFAAWQVVEAARQTWQAKAEVFNQLQQAKRPYELTITQKQTQLESQQEELTAQAERVTLARSERQTESQRLHTAQAQLTQLAADLAAAAEQEAAWHTARATLQTLTHERQLWQQEQKQLQAQAQRMQQMQVEQTAVSQNRQEAQAALQDVLTRTNALSEQQQRYSLALADKNNLEAGQSPLKEKMTKLKGRIDGLEAEAGSTCPLCGQPLSEAHRQKVIADLSEEGKMLADQYRGNRQQIEALTAETTQLAAALKDSARLERELQTQQQRLAQAEARLEEIDRAVAEWEAAGAGRLQELDELLADETAVLAQQKQVEALAVVVEEKKSLETRHQEKQRALSTAEARLAEIDRLVADWEAAGAGALAAVSQQLAAGAYAADAQAALADLERQIQELGYDPEAHQEARQAQAALAQVPARHQELKQVEAAVKPLEDGLADLKTQVAAQSEAVADLAQQQETAVQKLEALAADGGDLHAVEDEVFTLREEHHQAQRQVGAAEMRLEVLAQQRQRRTQYQAEQGTVKQQIQRLKLLEKACGRNGVQALLIEQALPDIEDRANELLERLTGGDMRVHFETQRQLKSRQSTVETLDIQISDRSGERPYENFSGGEQFRVNFAIRLALSQILAKRAGARLQTLVIDEGFGSQDPNGRQRLIEAINTIQDDFSRILVITHIDELRDAFPTRIEVEKRPSGSALTVA